MDRYKIKYDDGKHYVIDTLCDDKIVSSGYYEQKMAEKYCDRMNFKEDTAGMRFEC